METVAVAELYVYMWMEEEIGAVRHTGQSLLAHTHTSTILYFTTISSSSGSSRLVTIYIIRTYVCTGDIRTVR